MGWEREYEHWRDMGHTWGPGIDDVREYSEEELALQQKAWTAYQKKLAAHRVAPREEYLQSGKELEENLPPRKDRIYGTVSYDWRSRYNDAQLALCRQAAESLGYSFDLFDQSTNLDLRFAVTIDYYGWLSDRSGNIHRYAATGIQNIEDCLQLAADFSAIGKSVTTYFDKHFHYSCRDTGELYLELERLCSREGITLPTKVKQAAPHSLDAQVAAAKDTASISNSTRRQKGSPFAEQEPNL